ncbi:sulfotransferase family protein [Zavarzinia compransoris]|uniref:Sulfotransferase family protein n=2 Tax=Zavarzinia compransoris TaxID=1264899 RepID=A0A317E0D6_9PROT|nr:sulfotransferase family protein [Zavarzinia compransoris]
MWSGPRNISTAMMRAFENRADTTVVDEPLYGFYLKATGIDHPGRDEIVAAMTCDWRPVVRDLTTGPIARGRIHYQKHMTHHLLPAVGRDWLDRVVNCFLIRDPAEVVASYLEKRADVTLADIGVREQWEIFERAADRLGRAPPVIEGRDIQADPEAMLRALCAAIGIGFDPAMLSWPAGRRDTDGIWAHHWYGAVEASTGFGPPAPAKAPPPGHEALIEAAELYYRRLRAHRLTGAP